MKQRSLNEGIYRESKEHRRNLQWSVPPASSAYGARFRPTIIHAYTSDRERRLKLERGWQIEKKKEEKKGEKKRESHEVVKAWTFNKVEENVARTTA